MWAKRPEFQALVEETKQILKGILEAHRCYIAFSGGKDSTVLLHLGLQIQPDVPVFYWDHGPWLMPRNLHQEILRNAEKLGVINLTVKSYGFGDNPRSREEYTPWYRAFFGTLKELMAKEGWEIAILGMRKEEGKRRAAKIRKPPKGEAYPLAEWTYRDVWGYILSRELPYLTIYDRYGPLVGWDQARLVTFFDKEFECYGSPVLDGVMMPEFKNPLRKGLSHRDEPSSFPQVPLKNLL